MNIKSIIIAAVALTMGLSACNKEEALTQDGIPANAVQITASIGNPFAATRSNPVGTVEDQGKFNSGDEIMIYVPTTEEMVVYKLNGANWTPNGNKYLLWKNEVASFLAYYPIIDLENMFWGIQQDQSTLAQLSKSDLMQGLVADASKGTELNFEMLRQTSRIIINIAEFNPEFQEDSKVLNVNIVAFTSDFRNPAPKETTFIPYPSLIEDGKAGSTYTMLVGGLGFEYNNMHVTLKVGNKEMRSADLPLMEIGKSYTYNLIVGKEKLGIESVTVEDWTTKDVVIPGGQAEEELGS